MNYVFVERFNTVCYNLYACTKPETQQEALQEAKQYSRGGQIFQMEGNFIYSLDKIAGIQLNTGHNLYKNEEGHYDTNDILSLIESDIATKKSIRTKSKQTFNQKLNALQAEALDVVCDKIKSNQYVMVLIENDDIDDENLEALPDFMYYTQNENAWIFPNITKLVQDGNQIFVYATDRKTGNDHVTNLAELEAGCVCRLADYLINKVKDPFVFLNESLTGEGDDAWDLNTEIHLRNGDPVILEWELTQRKQTHHPIKGVFTLEGKADGAKTIVAKYLPQYAVNKLPWLLDKITNRAIEVITVEHPQLGKELNISK